MNGATPTQANIPTNTLDWPWSLPPALVQRTVDAQALARLEVLPPQVGQALQRRLLAELVSHAMLRSSFWRGRLGLSTSEQVLARWAQLPMLSRGALRQSADGGALAEPAGRLSTRGSTDAPLALFTTETADRMVRAWHHADHLRYGVDLTQARAVLSGRVGAQSRAHTQVPGIAAWAEAGLRIRGAAQGGASEHLAWLGQFPAHSLLVDVAVLQTLMDALGPDDAAAPSWPKQVFTVNGRIGAALREQVRTRWGARLQERYSAEEIGPVAYMCAAQAPSSHDCLHVASANALVEVVQADGTPCESGQSGHVLATALHNYANPMLRYSLGDMATWHHQCPACGAPVSTLTEVQSHAAVLLDLGGTRQRFWRMDQALGGGPMSALRASRVEQLPSGGLHFIADDCAAPLNDAQLGALSASLRAQLGAQSLESQSQADHVPIDVLARSRLSDAVGSHSQ